MNDDWKSKKYYSLLTDEEKADVWTRRQWAQKGFVPINEDWGALLYTSRCHLAMYRYYSSIEVREGSKEEIEAFFAPEKARLKARYAEKSKYLKYRRRCAKAAASAEKVEPCRTIVLDTETTGLNHDTDEILQLAIIDAKTGRKLFNEYFHPCFTESWPQAQKVNRISPRKVATKPMFVERVEAIQKIINSAETIIGYNTFFDLEFLMAYGVRIDDVKNVVDVMQEYSPDHWKKLTETAFELGYDWKKRKAHDALGDCYATLYCYENMDKIIFF